MSRISIFTGHFGSGKTEIALNYVMDLAKTGKKVALVDIDIVNPYFCSRHMKDKLEKLGVKLIASSASLMNAELMVIPSNVYAVFNDKSYEVVMDIGGDDQGSLVLRQYNEYLKQESYDMYFVVNNNRPFTSNKEETIEYLRSIERASGLIVTYLISNTNLSYESNTEDIIKGDKIVSEISFELKIPYKYIVCTKDLEESIKNKVHAQVYSIDIYMKPPWRE
ncbi:nucleotide-binding protein [Clostridium lacusfryxellense]|uniref:nucleotide-binding protein n=1 Tax=Clostridium lacusfryxellense TaxID=205328 RepID=UPI001C0BE45B|nr:ATP-binding protein [Clostridium lacusfryxellense]MBU3113814.1 ATP-binding protein [Clostridium lacusfryxellense]